MGVPPISRRAAIAFAVLAIALELLASALYTVAAGPSSGLSVEPLKLLASGATGAALIHWGSLIDMFGYLSIAPVVLYLRARYSSGRYVDIYAVAGLMLVVIGSIGAVSMAAAAPPLIREYITADAAQKAAIAPAFATLYRTVVIGFWQTLETIPAAVWLLGSAWTVRRDGPRSVFFILLAFGLVTATIALYRLVAAG